jgi:hypothetical protein
MIKLRLLEEQQLNEGQIKVLQKKEKNKYNIVDVILRDSNSSNYTQNEIMYKGEKYQIRRHPKFKDCIIIA